MIQVLSHCVCSMLLSEQLLMPAIQIFLFLNFEDPMPANTLFSWRKATYHPLLISYFQKPISMLDVWHKHVHIAHRYISTAIISLRLWTYKLSPNDKDTEMNRKFPLGNNLRQNTSRLKNEGKKGGNEIFKT